MSKKKMTTHDRKVREIANKEKKKGRIVTADVRGFSKPNPIKGRIPDIVSKDRKTGVKRIVEVETPISMKISNDKKQRKIFRDHAKRSDKTKYRTVVTKK